MKAKRGLTNMPRAHIFVSGQVHGVGFRFFASRTANSLGLKGFARNLDDGRVEIIAEGPKEKLERLVEMVRKGPIGTIVEKVQTEWEKETNEFNGFEIRF